MKTKENIIDEVLELYLKTGSLIDSVCSIAEKENIEIETISTIFKNDSQLREIIRTEGINSKMVTP